MHTRLVTELARLPTYTIGINLPPVYIPSSSDRSGRADTSILSVVRKASTFQFI